MHRDWAAQGSEHYGIIAVQKMTPLGEVIRRLQRHLDAVEPEYQYNVWIFLPA
ncbi:MAG: hypothetical protein ACR2JY_23015 [Chloroflexota bacterium]